MIHGGGWKANSNAYRSMVATAPIYQHLGYETLTFDYRSGAQGVADAERFYRIARGRVGSKLPICAVGTSAGGHIALMLAVQDPDLSCVVDFAGPTDLPALVEQSGGRTAYQLAVQAFGKSALKGFSPALQAKRIRARLLLVYAQDDPIVPAAQGQEMARADPRARLIMLPPGHAPFVHSTGAAGTGVDAAAKAQASRAEVEFLDAVSRSPSAQ